jgi:small-conductance mechanosensitive channel
MMDLIKFEEFWKLINGKLQNWLETGVENIPNLVVAIVVICLFAIIARFASFALTKLFRRSMESIQIANLLVSILRVFILGVGLFIALELLGLKGTVTSLLAGAGIIGLAIGFAFQDMTENLIAGIAMGIRKPFQVGDIISTESVFGKVQAINLRNTLVETFAGQMEVIPNKILFRNILTNFSHYNKRRVDVPVGISYADDPEKAREKIVDVINDFDFVIDKESTAVYAEGFGDSSVNLVVWFWIVYPGNETGYMEARHKAVVAIKRSLEEADILIPFPIRTLEFDAKGGTKLESIVSEHMSSQGDNSSHKGSANEGHSQQGSSSNETSSNESL